MVGSLRHIGGLLDPFRGEPPTKSLGLYFRAGGNSERLRRYYWGFFHKLLFTLELGPRTQIALTNFREQIHAEHDGFVDIRFL